MALSGAGLRGLNWLASDTGFSVSVQVHSWECVNCSLQSEKLWERDCLEGMARGLTVGYCQV